MTPRFACVSPSAVRFFRLVPQLAWRIGSDWRLARLLSLAALFILMSQSQGCGFQLRGLHSAQSLAFKEVALIFADGSFQTGWDYQLRQALRRAGLSLVPTADTQLIITRINSERRTISYDRRGKAAEYLLSQTVSFELMSQAGNVSQPPLKSTATRSRVYTFDPQNISGKGQEEQILQRELRSELIQEIFTQLIHYGQRPEIIPDRAAHQSSETTAP